MFNRSKEPTPKAAETGQDAPSPNGRLSLRQAFLLLLAASRLYALLLISAVLVTGLAGWKSLTEVSALRQVSPPPISAAATAPKGVEPAAVPTQTAPVPVPVRKDPPANSWAPSPAAPVQVQAPVHAPAPVAPPAPPPVPTKIPAGMSLAPAPVVAPAK